MTMSSAVSKVTLNGDGVQTSWPFAFKVWKAADLEVSITNAAGVTTVVSNWSVVLAGTGGTVTYPTSGDPLPSGSKITIARSMDFLQDVDLVSGTRWDPEVMETALDIACAERQQLKERVGRALTVDIAASTTPEALLDSIFAAKDTAVSSASSALDSAERAEQAATTVAYYSHEGTLPTGEDTIDLPWSYDTQVGVEVYLGGVKQASSVLTFTDPYTVTLDAAVTADTPFEVVASVGARGDLANQLAQASGADLVGFSHDIAYDVGTLGAKLKGVVSVKDAPYNAVGNGIADDTSAIQAAIDSVASLGGGTIYFPVGTYKTTAPLTVTQSGTRLVGASKDKAKISAVGCDGIQLNGPTLQCVEVSNLRIQGDGTTGTYGLWANLVIRGSVLRDLLIYGFGTAGTGGGLLIGNNATLGTWSLLVDNVTVEGCGQGILARKAQNITLVSCVSRLNKGNPLDCSEIVCGAVIGGTFENSASAQGAVNSIGINLSACLNFSFSGVYTEGLIDRVVKLSNCQAVSFAGCRLHGIESASGRLVELSNGSTHNTFRGCTLNSIYNAGQLAILLDETSGYNNFENILIEIDGVISVSNPISDAGVANSFINVTKGVDYTTYGVKEFTPSVSFSTNGDFIPTIDPASRGRVSFVGKRAFIDLYVKFNTNAFTTASGAFRITGLPFTVVDWADIAFFPLECGIDNVSYGTYNEIIAGGLRNASELRMYSKTSNAGYVALSTSNIQASKTNIVIRVSGSLEVK